MTQIIQRSIVRNIFEEIAAVGHDEDFMPSDLAAVEPTDAPIGSWRKIEELARRVKRGEPVFHPHDLPDYGEPEKRLRKRR